MNRDLWAGPWQCHYVVVHKMRSHADFDIMVRAPTI